MSFTDLSQQIVSAEKNYKKRLEDFISDIFRGANLSSHGVEHHRRVWSYAKILKWYLSEFKN
jgi:hypothetical protein